MHFVSKGSSVRADKAQAIAKRTCLEAVDVSAWNVPGRAPLVLDDLENEGNTVPRARARQF